MPCAPSTRRRRAPPKSGGEGHHLAGASVGYGALLATSVAAIKAAGLEGKLRMIKMEPAVKTKLAPILGKSC